MKIKSIKAREILDSRSNPTIEVKMELENGIKVKSSIPSGASTGLREAIELRDNDERFHGKGVLKAVYIVNNIIAPELVGCELNQKEIDQKLLELDGTINKSKLGANSILGVSLCVLKAIAKASNKEIYEYLGNNKQMPQIMVNVINGGKHADNNLDIQEFMLVPKLKNIKENIRCASEIFNTLRKMLKEDNLSTGVGDEGGFAPNLNSNEDAFKYLIKAIEKSNYRPGVDVCLAIDCAASSMYENGLYNLDGKKITGEELLNYYLEMIEKYPIISIEDPFYEDDFEILAKFTDLVKDKIMVVGDDFFVSQAKYLQKGINEKCANAILLKANQVGTITEFFETIDLARKNNYKMIISHRSGETEDTFIADFAVGLGIPFIKTGSVSRGERIAKYNRLMEIEEDIN